MKLLGHGLTLWGFVFAVGSALYPLSVDSRRAFEAVMLVVLAVATALASLLHLRGVRERVLREALVAACVWPALCVALDLVMSMVVPPRFGVGDYLREFGLRYLIVPAIVMGVGGWWSSAASSRARRSS